jgi:serine/threonine protein kinase
MSGGSEPSDRVLDHLREVSQWPDLGGTRYELLGEVARGGMGVVYRARDRELGRDVALKLIALGRADHAGAERLRREARTLARLEHPGIVPVHDVGVLPDGRVFYAMKLVSGQRLDELVRGGLALRERLRLVLRIAEPVAFAHAQGVIHRDLKPENVMVGPFGEVLVMDWGVAKHLATPPDSGGGQVSAVGETAHGTIVGTPGYMAPEQARGEVERVDARSDVYALGAVLHFALTGRAPRARAASSDTTTRTWAGRRAAAATGAMTPPRELDPGLPRALEAICLKALAPDPDERYQRVVELADDVERFLEGERVLAHPEGLVGGAGGLASRYRTPILLVLAYVVMRLALLLAARV